MTVRIALMATCLVDGVRPSVGRATVALLRRLGHEVVVPAEQTCCGQLHLNSGYRADGLRVVRHHVAAFEPYDVVVAPSGSCVGSVRHQHADLASGLGDRALAHAAEGVASRTYELSELLVDVLGVEDVGGWFPYAVTYHPTCHSLRVLRVGDRPLRLLRRVEEISLRELPRADSCCGFGGTFALKNADVSAAMLADKVAEVRSSGAEVLCASDSSCLLHIGGGLSRADAAVRPVHLAEILASTRDDPWRAS